MVPGRQANGLWSSAIGEQYHPTAGSEFQASVDHSGFTRPVLSSLVTGCSVPRRALHQLEEDCNFRFQKTNMVGLGHRTWGHGYRAWSRDGKYLYFETVGTESTGYYRIQLGQTRPELVVDLKDLRQFQSNFGPWSGITPDGSPLFVRDLSTDEIYAVDLELP
jgi:hypothetical protein